MAEGFRVIAITYTFCATKEEAKKLALKGRGEGKRTQIITEEVYNNPVFGFHLPMTDLTKE